MLTCDTCGKPFESRRPRARFCSRPCGLVAAHAVRHAQVTPWQERFWRFVPAERTDDGCWEWQGHRTPGGYGRLMVTKTPQRGMMAHRASWIIHNGEIADGLKVCHRCDNPRCVNPAHLFVGTQAENVADMLAKGRRRPDMIGEGHPRSKWSSEQVAAVRQLAEEGLTQGEISRRTGVSVNSVKLIRSGRTRMHD